eukprot:4420739-Amphidinium_carterae.2
MFTQQFSNCTTTGAECNVVRAELGALVSHLTRTPWLYNMLHSPLQFSHLAIHVQHKLHALHNHTMLSPRV